MEREEAIMALKDLGLSIVEINEALRVERSRRANKDKMRKRLQAGEIIRDMTL